MTICGEVVWGRCISCVTFCQQLVPRRKQIALASFRHKKCMTKSACYHCTAHQRTVPSLCSRLLRPSQPFSIWRRPSLPPASLPHNSSPIRPSSLLSFHYQCAALSSMQPTILKPSIGLLLPALPDCQVIDNPDVRDAFGERVSSSEAHGNAWCQVAVAEGELQIGEASRKDWAASN